MATITSVGSGLWSAAGTWDAGVPVDNDVVIIALGHVVEFDVDQSGFANGIDGLTITGTLSLTRSAGTYYLKIKASKTIAGAGTFDCGTSVSPIPFAAKHTITGGAAWYINGASGLTMTVYAAEPTYTTVKLTEGEPLGETVLAVDTDVTGDIWAAGDTIRIDNVNKGADSEERVIDAGGIAAGTITITAGLTAAKIAGTLVHLITRNVQIISACNSTAGLHRNFASGKIAIGGGAFIGNSQYMFNTCPGITMSGGTQSKNTRVAQSCADMTITGGVMSGNTYGLFSCPNANVSGGYFSGMTNAFYVTTGLSISGGTFSGQSSVIFSSTGIYISGGTFSGNAAALSSLTGATIFGGTFIDNANGITSSSMEIKGASFTGNTNDINVGIYDAFNTLFSGTAENTGYTTLSKEAYSQSFDHDQVQGAYRAWTKGGITTKQAVTIPTGYTAAMQTILADANYEGYWQKEVSVGAGQSVNLDLWFRKTEAMVYLPRCYVFLKRETDPFAGGTPIKTFTMTDSIDTWDNDTYTYANDGTQDETLIIRFQGKNASGSMFSALTVTVLNVDLTDVLAHLVDIKGAGWVDEDLTTIDANVDAIAANVTAILEDTGTTLPADLLALIAWQAVNLDESITEGQIIQVRGNSWDIDIIDLTLSNNKQQFAIKPTHRNTALAQPAPAWNVTTPDADSIVFIDSDTGLLYLNGDQAADPTLGSLSYVGTTLTITLKPAATQLLAPGTYTYGIQSVDALGVVSEVYGGTFTITADVVRSIT
jgi:hypothetical protein